MHFHCCTELCELGRIYLVKQIFGKYFYFDTNSDADSQQLQFYFDINRIPVCARVNKMKN